MKTYFDLKGQVALVTGCSTGLGVQMAKALASQGCNIVAVARRQEMLDKVAAEIKAEFGVDAIGLRCDITDTELVNETVKKALEALPFISEARPSHEADNAVITLSGDFDENAVKDAIEAKDYTYIGLV